MDKTSKKNKKDVEAWLLNMCKAIGKPIIVSLLIDRNGIDFLGCTDKKQMINHNDDDEEEPDINFKNKLEGKGLKMNPDYFG